MMQLQSHTAQAYMEAIARMGGSVCDHERCHRVKLPRQMGAGVWEYYPLQSGLELSISRYQMDHAFSVEFTPGLPLFSFGILLEGGVEVRDRMTRRTTRVARGQGLSMWACEGSYRFQMMEGCYSTLSMLVDPQLLLSKLDGADLLPPSLERALTSTSFPGCIKTNSLSSLACEAGRQVLASSPEDPLQRLLLESCSLTILREQILAIWPQEGGKRSLHRRDTERVHAARDLLLRNSQHSVRLTDLAHEVGLNEFSLKQGFRLHFGLSIHEFLRKQRLEIADQLLAEGEYSVAEIAGAVGYRCGGRFAAAFRKQFGYTPKQRQMGMHLQRIRLERSILKN